jgi:hypothetical protein
MDGFHSPNPNVSENIKNLLIEKMKPRMSNSVWNSKV